MLIKIKFKWVLSIMSRYTFNIFKGYKKILEFRLTLNSKEVTFDNDNKL